MNRLDRLGLKPQASWGSPAGAYTFSPAIHGRAGQVAQMPVLRPPKYPPKHPARMRIKEASVWVRFLPLAPCGILHFVQACAELAEVMTKSLPDYFLKLQKPQASWGSPVCILWHGSKPSHSTFTIE